MTYYVLRSVDFNEERESDDNVAVWIDDGTIWATDHKIGGALGISVLCIV